MFPKTTWMSRQYITQATEFFRTIALNEYGHYSQAEVDGAEEGLACLDKAKPGYLINLIRQDHPDRIMALHLLTRKEER